VWVLILLANVLPNLTFRNQVELIEKVLGEGFVSGHATQAALPALQKIYF
jgi:uncharacterized protein YoaH (UPF0181 family)